MKHNKNSIDRACNTKLMARATIAKVNGGKDVPFWLGLTDGEKYGKRFASERANCYRRNTDKRREFKAFYLRLCDNLELRERIKKAVTQ